jgi:type I restriction enzyme M protein
MAKKKEVKEKNKKDSPVKVESSPKAKKQVEDKPIEVTLWDAANKLRGGVEPAEYKHIVLSLIFLKFAADKFEAQRAKLIADKKEKYLEMP